MFAALIHSSRTGPALETLPSMARAKDPNRTHSFNVRYEVFFVSFYADRVHFLPIASSLSMLLIGFHHITWSIVSPALFTIARNAHSPKRIHSVNVPYTSARIIVPAIRLRAHQRGCIYAGLPSISSSLIADSIRIAPCVDVVFVKFVVRMCAAGGPRRTRTLFKNSSYALLNLAALAFHKSRVYLGLIKIDMTSICVLFAYPSCSSLLILDYNII